MFREGRSVSNNFFIGKHEVEFSNVYSTQGKISCWTKHKKTSVTNYEIGIKHTIYFPTCRMFPSGVVSFN